MFWNRVRSQACVCALGLTWSTGPSCPGITLTNYRCITFVFSIRFSQNTPQKCSGTGGKTGLVSTSSLELPHITRAFLRLFFPLTRQSIPYTRMPGTLA